MNNVTINHCLDLEIRLIMKGFTMLKKFVKSNKYLFSLALSYKESKLNKDSSKLSDDELKFLQELEENGVVVIPNFYSEEECKSMIASFEALSDKHAKQYANDKRIFGIEKISDIHNLHHDNQMFKRIGEAYVGDELILQTTMAAKIVPDEKEEFGSGGSWHRDSFSKQFKAITYLDDVSIDNGPFMYIKGSHKMENIKKILFELDSHNPPSNFRYTNEEIEKIKEILNEEITYFTAPKGTLVLADIRGLHTGMPIKEGHRYSVFNYYIAKSYYQNDNEIEKLATYNNV